MRGGPNLPALLTLWQLSQNQTKVYKKTVKVVLGISLSNFHQLW